MLRVLRFPLEKISDKAVSSMRSRVTSVREQLNRAPSLEMIKQAILEGLSETLEYEMYPGELTMQEDSMLAKMLPSFQSDDWVYGNGGKVVNTVDSTVNYKAPGGLIRVQMRLDEKAQVIKYVIISGDFFAYPARAVNDLETVMKNTPVSRNHIEKKIRSFFSQENIHILGVGAEDFIAVMLLAVERSSNGRASGEDGLGGNYESCAGRL